MPRLRRLTRPLWTSWCVDILSGFCDIASWPENTILTRHQKAAKEKLDLAQPSKDKDSPQSKQREELRGQLKSIRDQQPQFKSSRGNTQEKIAALDTQLKSRLAEQKAARGRVNFKNVEEVDREIQRLQKQVESGTMKIVDEKKALAEISNLNKTKKSFAGLEETEKQIQAIKAQISDLKKGMDNPEQKALSERYTAIMKELDSMKSLQDDVYKNLGSLRDERSKLQDEQKKTWAKIREVKDEYFASRNAFRDYEFEARRQRNDKIKQEREAFAKEKRRKVAEEKLETASQPAYMDQILSAEGLIRHFDPSTPVESKVLREPSKLGAQAQRTVDASQMKGTALKKKGDEEEAYFVGSGGKKGKKGKKAAAAGEGPSEGKFNLNMGVIEEFSKVGVEPPSTHAEIPAVIEKLKAKVADWKSTQDSKTKEVSCENPQPISLNSSIAECLQGPGRDRQARGRSC